MTKYQIKSGDNLTKLAKRFGTNIEDLMQANGITDPDKIYAGKSLVIPGEKQSKSAPLPASKAESPLSRGASQIPLPQELRPSQGMTSMGSALEQYGSIPTPESQALQGSYPELLAMGIPGLLRGSGAAAGTAATAQNYRGIPEWLMNPATQGVMRQNPTRNLNALSKAAIANEKKFNIVDNVTPDALMLERALAVRRLQL